MKIPDAKAAVEKNWEKLEKVPAWQLTKVRNKKKVIEEARNYGRKVHFASLMDLCHLKNSELEPKYQKYKGRVELRGDIVKDDSGSYAVFTEQGSSASQMTAAKVMDIISRQPGCARQAADAVSAYTQVKMEDAPTLFTRYLDSSFKTQMANIMVHYGRPSCSWTEFVRSSFGRTMMGTAIRGSSTEIRLGKIPNWECLFVNWEKGLFLSVCVDDIKLAGKKQNIGPTWKILMKDFDLGEPTSSLNHVYLGCTQRECQISKNIVDNYRSMFESRISAGTTTEKLSETNATGKFDAETISSWWKVMQGNAWKK